MDLPLAGKENSTHVKWNGQYLASLSRIDRKHTEVLTFIKGNYREPTAFYLMIKYWKQLTKIRNKTRKMAIVAFIQLSTGS